MLVAILFCFCLWWVGTGAVLLLHNVLEVRHWISLLCVTLFTALAGFVFTLQLEHVTESSAYLSVACALVFWGWLEVFHLSGLTAGPRKEPCPEGVGRRERFKLALQAMFFREATVATVALLLVYLSWHAPNKTGVLAFLILCFMRVSAEICVFFGVSHLPEHWLPQPTRYLMTYRDSKKTGKPALFCLALVVVATVFMFLVFLQAAPGFHSVSSALLVSLLLLGVVEHLLLVIPFPVDSIWSWAWLKQRAGTGHPG